MNIRIPAAVVQHQPAPSKANSSNKLHENERGAILNKTVPAATPAADIVELSASAKTELTYPDPRLNKGAAKPDLEALLEESNRKAQAIVDLILPLVKQQGLNLAKVVSGEQKLNVDPKTIEAAKAAIAPDGEFGVQKTAERILSFAKAAIGGDPAKLDKIRAAVERGFKEAADILGGSLPEISQQTLSAIETEFDHWKADRIPAGDSVTLSINAQPDKVAG